MVHLQVYPVNEIVDNNGNFITSVQTVHFGMGVFSLVPESGKKYFLKCRNRNGVEQQFDLPQTMAHAFALTATQINNCVSVSVRQSSRSPDIPLYLLAHCRGRVVYFAAWDKARKSAVIPEETLPAGVIQWVLFDEAMNPLSERLVFNKDHDPAKVEFHTDRATYSTREQVISTLSIVDADGNPLSGHLSVAVTDDMDLAVDSTTTISSTLLLSSELRGYIENSAFYLQDNDRSAFALDLLMMTHGWRRYDVAEAISGNPANPQISFQQSQAISGRVQSELLSRPVAGSEIIIQSKAGYFGITSTDENGAFRVDDLEYPDSTSFFVQARNRRGNSNVELVMNREIFPGLIHAPQSDLTESMGLQEEAKSESEPDAFLRKAELHALYDEDIRMMYIPEVVISAQRKERKEEPRLQYWINEGSDRTIRREDFEKTNPTLVTDLLLRVPGVNVFSDGKISIRGGGLPLVIINGITCEWNDSTLFSPFEWVDVQDVESIDVFTGGSAAVFGSRGQFGAISITTRSGGVDFSKTTAPNHTVYTPLGYQTPVEFYSPKYETLEAKVLNIPDFRTTLFWKPDIVISVDEESGFEFYTSDFQTTYTVVIEGVTTDGRTFRQVEKIEVKKN